MNERRRETEDEGRERRDRTVDKIAEEAPDG
jgi:hypothetical protein